MKKTTKTTATTPASSKSAGTSQPKAAKKTAPKKSEKAPVAAPVAVIAKAPATPAPAVKTVEAVRPATVITAQIDVGFGNTLFLRGEGPGLSWESGVPLECVADDKWSFSLAKVDKPVVFKLLVNDLTWCTGEDYVVQPGSEVVVTPAF